MIKIEILARDCQLVNKVFYNKDTPLYVKYLFGHDHKPCIRVDMEIQLGGAREGQLFWLKI